MFVESAGTPPPPVVAKYSCTPTVFGSQVKKDDFFGQIVRSKPITACRCDIQVARLPAIEQAAVYTATTGDPTLLTSVIPSPYRAPRRWAVFYFVLLW